MIQLTQKHYAFLQLETTVKCFRVNICLVKEPQRNWREWMFSYLSASSFINSRTKFCNPPHFLMNMMYMCLDWAYNSGIQPNNFVHRILFSNQSNGDDGTYSWWHSNSNYSIFHLNISFLTCAPYITLEKWWMIKYEQA